MKTSTTFKMPLSVLGQSVKGFQNLLMHSMGVYVDQFLTVHWVGYSNANKLAVRLSG